MTKETQLGLFVLFSMILLVISIMMLGDFQFQKRYTLDIYFNDIAGLPSKSRVKIAGVEVGGVKDITLEGDKAKVTVWMASKIKVHKDTKARVVATGIIGSKFLELTMGSQDQPILEDGDKVIGIDPVSFDKVLSDLMETVDSLVAPLQGDGDESLGKNLSATISNLKKITDSLRSAIGEQEDRINRIVKNVDEFTADLADITGENKEDIRVAIREIRSVSEKLDKIVSKVEKGEGTLGKLFADESMGNDLKSTFSDLKETMTQAKGVMRRLNLIETQWDYNARYDSSDNMMRSDLGLRIIPRPGKYYFLGVSNIGDSDTSLDKTEDSNTINALIGKRFEMLDVYAGAIRSKGGVGMKVRPLWKWEPWRRLEITAEGYDFSRKVPVAKAKVNAGVRVELAKWAYIGSQVEDVYDKSHVMTSANIVIRDDDIAYILGLVGLAKP